MINIESDILFVRYSYLSYEIMNGFWTGQTVTDSAKHAVLLRTLRSLYLRI